MPKEFEVLIERLQCNSALIQAQCRATDQLIALLKEQYGETSAYGSDWHARGIQFQSKGLVIAPEDYVDPETGKRFFSWTEAKSLKLPRGWRLPTQQEWWDIFREFGKTEEGTTEVRMFFRRLHLGYHGWVPHEKMEAYNLDPKGSKFAQDQGEKGIYWSDTLVSKSFAERLEFSRSGNVDISGTYNENGFSIRCVFGDPIREQEREQAL